MKRNSLFTKLLAMMLCVMMVVGCLPLSALADASDWESDIDIADPIPGSEEDPFEAVLGDNTAAADADDYNWVYTAEYTGTLVITSAADFTVNGTTFEKAEDAEEVSAELAVTAADEVKIYSKSFNLAYKLGSCPEYPINLDQSNTVINEGTVYYQGYFAGQTVTITGEGDFTVISDGEEIAAVDGKVEVSYPTVMGRPMPNSIVIIGNGEFTIVAVYPVGTMENPAIAVLGDNNATIAAGGIEYVWNYTAEYAGKLMIEVSTADGNWQYTVNNMTTYSYGDTQWSDSDPVVNPAIIDVSEGDVIEIKVITYDPAAPYAAPAGDINVNLAYKPGSCPEFPIFLEQVNTVNNEGTVYYQGYFAGQIVTITGEGDFTVISDGEEIAAVDGKVEVSYPTVMGRPMPNSIVIIGDGEFTIAAEYPVGTMENPATAVLGDNNATIAAGGSEYVWNYIAEKDGDLVITVSTASGNWQYTVNNLTTYSYGDTQWSDSDPVVNPATITVVAGDVIEIRVITYDPAAPYAAPAGDINTNLAYAPEGPVLNTKLKFYTIGLSFAEEIGVQPMVLASVVKGYDSFYVEAVHTTATESTTIEMVPAVSASSYTAYSLPMYARAMTDSVAFTLYAVKDGVTYCSETVETSITELALEKIASYQEDGELLICKVLVDMLVYGTEVQQGFGYKTEDVPENYLGEYASLGSDRTVAPTIGGEVVTTGSGIKAGANSISMKDRIEIQFAFKVSQVEGCELRYVLNGETYTIDASKFDTESISGYAVACIALKPRHFRDQMTMALYNIATGEAVSLVYTASVENYAAKTLSKYPELMPAIMNYGDSVLAAYPNK